MTAKSITLTLWSLLMALLCIAQETPMLHYTVDEGLPSNNVYCVYRDKLGFLWFGTDKGVARYNGLTFEKFTTSEGLADNEVFSFKEDTEGRLWMATYNGKLCFYKDGVFHSELNTPFLKLPFIPFCTSGVNLNYDGSITVTYRDPSRFLYIHKDKITVYQVPETLQFKTKHFRNLSPVIHKISGNQFRFYYLNKEVFTDTLLHIKKIKDYADNFIINNGKIIYQNNVYTHDWKYLFPSFIKFPSYSIEAIQKVHFIYNDENNIFYATRAGLMSNKLPRPLLEGKLITHIASDINGNYWISTYKHGIYYMSKKFHSTIKFDHVYNPPIERGYDVNGKFYYRFLNKNSLYCFDNGQTRMVVENEEDTREGYYWVCHHIVNANNIFVFSNRGGYKPGKGSNVRIKLFKLKDRFDLFFYSFLSRNYVYGLNQKQINRIDTNGSKHEYIQFMKVAKSEDARVIAKAIDAQQYLWFATMDGIYKTYGTIPIKQYLNNKTFRKFIFLEEYLIGYDEENTFYTYKIKNGNLSLISRHVQRGIAWGDIHKINTTTAILSTNGIYRIFKVNPSNDHISITPLNNVLVPNSAEYIYPDSNNCFFVKDGNILSIPLKDLFEKETPPKVLFTKVNTNKQSLYYSPEVNVRGTDANNISIEFSNISFLTKELVNEYSISTDPVQDQWREIKGNVLNLTSPGYNTYFIKVRTRSFSSEYSEPALLKLTITRPFWLTWWAITIEVICIAIILFFLTRMIVLYILNRRRKMYDLESRYHSAEYKTLNALMNPHFIFNSLNNIKGLMNRDDKKTANKFLNSFSNVIRQNMQNLSKEMVSLQEEIELVSKYLELEKLRFGDIINYEVNIEKGIDLEELFIPPLLIQPLAENAVKHGLLPKKSTDGLISVNIYEKQQSVFVAIKDNGVGLNNSDYSEHEGYESLGLSNIEKRLSYLRQSGKQQIFFSISGIMNEAHSEGTIAVIEIRMNK